MVPTCQIYIYKYNNNNNTSQKEQRFISDPDLQKF